MYTQDDYNVHFQNVRQLYIRIDWLNWTEYKIGETQGVFIDGNINITKESAIRRTCNLTLEITSDSYIPSETSYIWLNKKFRVWVGIMNLNTNNIQWFNKGIYFLHNPILNYSNTERTIQITGLDKMCWYDGTLSGEISSRHIIPYNNDITQALKSLAQIQGETKFNLDTINKTTPYTIENDIGDTIYQGIEEVNQLYAGWEVYYDEQGYFCFKKIKKDINDQVIWDFSNNEFSIKYQNQPDWANIKNCITIWGATLNNGTQIKHTLENTDINNPFSIAKIGRKELAIKDENIYTPEQAQDRAKYELFIHSNLNEKIVITCVPIYMLAVNKLISFDCSKSGIMGKYLISQISFNVHYDSEMQFTAYKIYT